MSDPKWIKRWNSWIAPKPSKPGVWRRKEGGFLVRGRAVDPHTGKMRDVKITLPEADLLSAYQALQTELERVRSGQAPPSPVVATTTQGAPSPTAELTLPSWGDYAVSLLERKVAEGRIRSAKNRIQWESVLKVHLLPAFGRLRVDEMTRRVFLTWRAGIAQKIQAGECLPSTANNWQTILAVVTNAAFDEFEIERKSPTLHVQKFDAREHSTYTDEEPNALTAEELFKFLKAMSRDYPQHFAMVALGFATGLRPSSLRPLRRGGKTPELLIEEGVLLIRRSHTVGEEVMETTKTGRRQRVTLPADLVAILRWHIDTLPEGVMADSELLFPSETGSYRAPSVLDKPFRAVSKAIGLRKHITPRAMRRTFQDLARAAEVKDIVTRAVSGHATEDMQQHYSTVDQREIQASLARVVSLAGFKEAHASGTLDKAEVGGVHGGVHRSQRTEGSTKEARPSGAPRREEGPGGVHGGVHRPQQAPGTKKVG